MKKLMVILLAGCVVVMSQGFREVAAGDDIADIFDKGGALLQKWSRRRPAGILEV